MELCVEIQAVTGIVQQSNQTIDECTEYVLLNAAEYANQPTLQDIFNIPIADDLQQMFMTGFSLPVIAYLTAWGYGVVINWFNRDPE